MINTISDLLLSIKEKEKEILNKENISHAPTIGKMYEGLTKEILEKSIFDGLNLKVTSGFVEKIDKSQSKQIDCMLVIGNGKRIPHTDEYIYNIENVIAIIEVKKNLFSRELENAYDNLKSIINLENFGEIKDYHNDLFSHSWKSLMHERTPSQAELEKFAVEKKMIFHTIKAEVLNPVRILLGYNGFKNEYSLRKSFIDFLGKNITTDEQKKLGFGPVNFPNLIIADKFSIIKNNGQPFSIPITDDYYWLLYSSSNENPMHFLLELIWTRLSYMFKLSAEIFGDDLEIESFHDFLICKFIQQKDKKGWLYIPIEYDKKEFKKTLKHKDWKPVFLDKIQYDIISHIIFMRFFLDKEIEKEIENTKYTLTSIIKSLKETGLVNYKDKEITLLTEQCLLIELSDGRFLAGENNTGRMERWISQNNFSVKNRTYQIKIL